MKRTAQGRTPFKSPRAHFPFPRTCIECRRKLTTTFLYCDNDKCAKASKAREMSKTSKAK